MASLVSLADFQLAVGAGDDDQQQMALDDASAAVLNWTDRDFGSTPTTETREYPYDGKGVLEIDDASAVTGVSGTLAGSNFIAMKEGPASVTVYSYLLLPPSLQPSGEMGFATNRDPLGLHFRSQLLPIVMVSVTGTFGWEAVPDDVRRAVIFTAQEYQKAAATNSSGDLQAKSVAEVAEAYFEGEDQKSDVIEGLPQRAVDILWPYKRHSF